MAKTNSPPMDQYSVDQYLAAQPSTSRAVLARVRAALQKALPGADEVISYQIPAYRLPGGIVLFFAGWKQHFSIYPVTPGVRSAFGDAIAPYVASKGTLRFSLTERVPLGLIRRIAKLRAQEVAARVAARAARRAAKKPASAEKRMPAKKRVPAKRKTVRGKLARARPSTRIRAR